MTGKATFLLQFIFMKMRTGKTTFFVISTGETGGNGAERLPAGRQKSVREHSILIPHRNPAGDPSASLCFARDDNKPYMSSCRVAKNSLLDLVFLSLSIKRVVASSSFMTSSMRLTLQAWFKTS